MAVHVLGLAAVPKSGFDATKVIAAFFVDGRCNVNFLVNLGMADPSGLRSRGPRLSFDELARIV